MADDSALIWDDDERRPRPARPQPPEREASSAQKAPVPGGRVSLRDAHRQFGVNPSTLSSWARTGKVDAVKENGRWMVTPASVAARLSSTRSRGTTGRRPDAPGPTPDGSTMLVPRDAWDKLMDQLGNLHEAGQMLAEARERAAKAETESVFLRDRLAEMRSERDQLRARVDEPVAFRADQPPVWQRIKSMLTTRLGTRRDD